MIIKTNFIGINITLSVCSGIVFWWYSPLVKCLIFKKMIKKNKKEIKINYKNTRVAYANGDFPIKVKKQRREKCL